MLLREVSPSRLSRSRQVPFSQVLYKMYPLTCGWVQWMLSYIWVTWEGLPAFSSLCAAATMADVEELEDDGLEVGST